MSVLGLTSLFNPFALISTDAIQVSILPCIFVAACHVTMGGCGMCEYSDSMIECSKCMPGYFMEDETCVSK